MTDPHARRKLLAGILLLIFFLISLIGEAMQDRIIRFWLGVILCSLVSFVVAVWLLMGVAFAHDHERPELNQWFMQLRSGKGLCCDGGEALHLRDVEWETQDKPSSHFRVKIPVDAEAYAKAREGQEVETFWVDVDDEAVIDEPNKAGAPLVWPVYSGHFIFVRCFMPGAEG